MNPPRYRAWRFGHPDFDASEGLSGLRISTTGGIDMVEEGAAVRQAVLLLLSIVAIGITFLLSSRRQAGHGPAR